MRTVLGRLLACLAVLLAAGCTSLPESGPVESAGSQDAGVETRGVYFDPPPPQPGATADSIVENFLVAMTAAPLQTSVARQYLTRDAAEAWNPTETYVYSGVDSQPATDAITITLRGAHRIDSRAMWAGPMSARQARLRFPVVLEGDEWRIARAPNALIVPDYQFEQAFRQAQVNWFDPSGSILVPEPVHVAGGESMPTALVRSLLLGPPPGMDGVVRTYFPEGLTATSVPVTPSGQADVRLGGTLPDLSSGALDRLVAQLAWTLRQVQGISSFRVTFGEMPLTLPGGVTEFPVEHGSEYDPIGLVSDGRLYARSREGGLVVGTPDGMAPARGSAREAAKGWRSLAVEPSGSEAAGVSHGGSAVELAAVGDPDADPVQIVSGATDLLEPTWDVFGHLWLVDRRPSGALVMLAGRNGRPESFPAPGISGERVRDVEVSRDGSRLVAVVAGAHGDHVVEARVRRDDHGKVVGLTPGRDVGETVLGRIRIRDLCWRSPTSVAVLFGRTNDVSEVRTISLDGGPDTPQTSVTTLRGEARWLIGSPDTSLPVFAATKDEAVPLVENGTVPRLGDVLLSTLDYVG